MSWHLAQVNIARTKAPFSEPSMAGLSSRIAEINALAEASPGFVWRFTTESNEANRLEQFQDYLVPFDRGHFFFNMSIWKSAEDLQHYTFQTAHLELFRNRQQWIDPLPRAHAALWWLPADQTPTVAEAKGRLTSIEQNGPTAFAFTFAKLFPPPTLAEASH